MTWAQPQSFPFRRLYARARILQRWSGVAVSASGPLPSRWDSGPPADAGRQAPGDVIPVGRDELIGGSMGPVFDGFEDVQEDGVFDTGNDCTGATAFAARQAAGTRVETTHEFFDGPQNASSRHEGAAKVLSEGRSAHSTFRRGSRSCQPIAMVPTTIRHTLSSDTNTFCTARRSLRPNQYLPS